MFKLFVDPGHGGSDPGATYGGSKEKDFTLDIGLRIRRIIQEEYTGVEVKMSRTKDVYPSLDDRVGAANRWGADFFLSIHINAGGGDGFESYRYTSAYSKTEAIQKTLHQEIVKGTGWKDRGVKKAGYYVLKHTKMPAVLTENLFIDNPSNLKLLKQASVREKCARAHVAGMAKAFGWKKKQAGPKPPEPTGGLWVVQCGAFKEKKNAEELKAKLEKAGFSAYIYLKS